MSSTEQQIAQLRSRIVAQTEEIQQLRMAIDVLSSMDPDTGLLNRNGIRDAIDDGLAWLMRRNERFSIVSVSTVNGSPIDVEQTRHQGALLSATVRRVDKVGVLSGGRYMLVCRDFKTEGAPALLTRLRASLAQKPEPRNRPHFALGLIKADPRHSSESLFGEMEKLVDSTQSDTPVVVEL